MKIKSHIIYCTVIVILLSVLCFFIFRPEKVVVKEVIKTETEVKEVHDTTIVDIPVEVEKRIVDTVYIHDDNGENLPFVYAKTRYEEPNLYDVWIEGYNAKMSSIMVFPKTVYKTITNTVEKEVETLKWNAYAGIGFGAICGDFMPKIGIYVTSPRKWLFGADFGYMKGQYYVGGTIAYKLTK